MITIILLVAMATLILGMSFLNTTAAGVITLVLIVTIFTVQLYRNRFKKKFNGTLTKDERSFIENNGIDAEEYITNKAKTFNELNLSHRINDALYFQKSLNLRGKMQAELAVAANLLKNMGEIEIAIDEEVAEKEVEYLEIYKGYAKKLKGKTIPEKLLNSNGIKFKSYFSSLPFLLIGMFGVFVGFVFVMPLLTSLLAIFSLFGLIISSKEKRTLNRKQKDSLKKLIFNLMSNIETLNDDIIGFARRNKHVIDKSSTKTINKFKQLVNITDQKFDV